MEPLETAVNARYFKMNVARVPLSTVWTWGLLQFVSFLMFIKWRRPRYAQVLIPAEPGLQRAEPRRDIAEFEAATAELTSLGFQSIGDFRAEVLGPTESWGRNLLSNDHLTSAVVTAVKTPQRPVWQISVGLASATEEGPLIATSAASARLPVPPGKDSIVSLPGGTPIPVLVTTHSARLEKRALRRLTPNDVVDLRVGLQARAFRYYCEIGLYEPANADDIARARQEQAAAHMPPSS